MVAILRRDATFFGYILLKIILAVIFYKKKGLFSNFRIYIAYDGIKFSFKNYYRKF